MPVICSRRTRLTASMRSCMTRNPGTIRMITRAITTNSIGTHAASSHESVRSSRIAMRMPPTIMIGAATIIVAPIRTSSCTCWTSFVVRVMSDGAPKWFISRAENDPTRWNRSRRTSRPKAIAVRAPKYTAIALHTICTHDTASITRPVRTM